MWLGLWTRDGCFSVARTFREHKLADFEKWHGFFVVDQQEFLAERHEVIALPGPFGGAAQLHFILRVLPRERREHGNQHLSEFLSFKRRPGENAGGGPEGIAQHLRRLHSDAADVLE